MSTKRDRSNRDADDSKRQGQNTSGQGPARGAHKSSDADKVPGKTGDSGGKKDNDSRAGMKAPGQKGDS